MDQFSHLYDKNDHPSYGMYKISLDEVADACGHVKGFDCNMKPYYRTLHELTNEYLVEQEEFITVKVVDDRIPFKTRFYNKDAFLLPPMLCDKHRKRNWLDNERLMRDNKTYINRITGITISTVVEEVMIMNKIKLRYQQLLF